MGGLEFKERAARQLEAIYQTRDIVAQRAETIRQLDLARGERVLDVGCGPGYLCEAMAPIVGRDGGVLGIDVSPELVACCERRKTHAWTAYEVGDATRIEHPDDAFDVVVCSQVAEYIPDVDKALAEAFRLLQPGGRAVFVATEWDAVVWHSDVPERMSAVLRCWQAHCAYPHLPRSLAHRLRGAGFRFDGGSVFPILNFGWEDDTYSKGMTALIRDFVAQKGEVEAEDLREWENELAHLSATGRYFFSSARFMFKVSKAGR